MPTDRGRIARGTLAVASAVAVISGPLTVAALPAQANTVGTAQELAATEPIVATIPDVQGSTPSSPLDGMWVETTGVVTAAYPTGNFNGFYVQVPGSGGDIGIDTHTRSDGIFVFGSAFVSLVEIGDYVRVSGDVSEVGGMTTIIPRSGGLTILDDPVEVVKPAIVAYPDNEADRETFEGMLVDPQGDYIVADNADLNSFGVVGLASGTTPLRQPTDVAPPLEPGGDNSAYEAVVADNAARAVSVDDGSSLNYLSSANKSIPLPYLTVEDPIRVGASAGFDRPVIFDFRNGGWNFQPTQQLTAANADAVQPATFENTRDAAPDDVGGDVTIASFNVLNYFTETGEDWTGDGGTCTFFVDRDSNPIANNTCSGPGPRGAANEDNLARQQAKIVSAINTLDASVVSLEEIENSINYGSDRDAALSILVDALNADADADKWEFVATPPDADDQTLEDVIRTAFIYQGDVVETVGDSAIFNDPAFQNARDPLAQAFRPVDGGDDSTFLVIVSHFKSKSSGEGVDADQGDGQGPSNFSRTVQAEALADFAADTANDVFAPSESRRIFLTGDFNSYTKEDPMQLMYNSGYVDIGSEFTNGHTYLFDGLVGSLDHVLASPDALDDVVGADHWNINSVESVALEYSRYNYNATIFYDESPYRSSDHDPLIVGVDLPIDDPDPVQSATTATADAYTYGQPGAIDVTVTSDPVATGAVEVFDGTTSLGTATLVNGAAEVALAGTALSPGTHVLTVNYAGDDGVLPSSTTVSVTVNTADSTTTANSPGVAYGTAPVVNVHVSSTTTPAGTVQIRRGTTLLGTATLSSGSAAITLGATALPVGTHTLTVNYLGSTNTNTSSTTTRLVVSKAVPTLTWSITPNRIVVNQTRARVAVTVTSNVARPTGQVKIRAGGKLVGQGSLQNGQVTITIDRFTSAGTKNVVIRYAGNNLHQAAEATTQMTVVRP